MRPAIPMAFRKRLAVLGLLALAFGFIACEDTTDVSPLKPKLFADIYTEMVVETIDSTDIDSLSHLTDILRKHAVTQEQFDASKSYFENHPDLWLDVFGRVEANLTKIKTDRNNQTSEQQSDSLK